MAATHAVGAAAVSQQERLAVAQIPHNIQAAEQKNGRTIPEFIITLESRTTSKHATGEAARSMIFVVPIRYEIDPHRKLIRTACVGCVNPNEISEHFRELASNPDRPSRLNVLLDLTEMTSLPETHQVRAANSELSWYRHILQFNACAIVAGNDTVFGMMRMFLTMAEDSFSVTQVFRTRAEAELWLASNEIPDAA